MKRERRGVDVDDSRSVEGEEGRQKERYVQVDSAKGKREERKGLTAMKKGRMRKRVDVSRY